MVGIVLNIQTNKRLRDSVDDCHSVAGFSGDPKVLHVEEKSNVAESTSIPSEGSKLLSAVNDLENLSLDLTFEWCVELVPMDTSLAGVSIGM